MRFAAAAVSASPQRPAKPAATASRWATTWSMTAETGPGVAPGAATWPATDPTACTKRSHLSKASPSSTRMTATIRETTRPSCSCRAGGGRMITAGMVSTGRASSMPVVSRPMLPIAAATTPGACPARTSIDACTTLPAAAPPGSTPPGRVAGELRAAGRRPGHPGERETDQEPQADPAARLEDDQHDEPPRPHRPQLGPLTEHRHDAGCDDVEPDARDEQADGAAAPAAHRGLHASVATSSGPGSVSPLPSNHA